jgi:HPt (histidine-containing phosphotransfer) domain-containing protein
MSFEPGALDQSLLAAVGDSPALIAELRAAFVQALVRQLDALESASTADVWIDAAHRLRGLAASFGADDVMDAAANAVHCRPGDRATLARLREACRGLAA